MARARRLKARGDSPSAISGCSSFAARLGSVKLRAQLPSRRVTATTLSRYRPALSGQEVGCEQSGRARVLLKFLSAMRPRRAALATTLAAASIASAALASTLAASTIASTVAATNVATTTLSTALAAATLASSLSAATLAATAVAASVTNPMDCGFVIES